MSTEIQDSASDRTMQIRWMELALKLVWGLVAVGVLYLAALGFLPGGFGLPGTGGAPRIGVVDIQGLVEEYQHQALDAARDGDEKAQQKALESADFAMARIDRALQILAQRHEDVVFVQAQAVAAGQGVRDYTPELRRIIDPTFQSGGGGS